MKFKLNAKLINLLSMLIIHISPKKKEIAHWIILKQKYIYIVIILSLLSKQNI